MIKNNESINCASETKKKKYSKFRKLQTMKYNPLFCQKILQMKNTKFPFVHY